MNTRKAQMPIGSRHGQQGAALIVGLVLLMVLTVLGVSGMNSSTLELTMASNAQFHQDAFQAAETGIDILIESRTYSTVPNWPGNIVPVTPLGDGTYTTQAVTAFTEATPVPDGGFSGGEGVQGTMQAFHFDIVSTGIGSRGATSTHNQSFYQIGPGGP